MLQKALSLLLLLVSIASWAAPIKIVAAENFYGDIARKLGGPYVRVTSILSNPNQDPHLFSSDFTTAKAIADADLIIYNGINYDPWMVSLLQPVAKQHKSLIVVANLLGKHPGDNPHLWYDPNTMLIFSKELVVRLSQLDPPHKNYYQQQLVNFQHDYQQLTTKIAQLKQHYYGSVVIATEPVFNYMAAAVGLTMTGENFQLSMMNETEPSAKDTRDFEDKLNKHQVAVLIYNRQISNPVTQRLKDLAQKAQVPTVGVSETQPLHQDYLSWMEAELHSLELALKTTRN